MPGEGDIPADTFSHILEGPGVDFRSSPPRSSP